jgi:heme/copper-type cytochrome/quinol oxidase subunit 2
MRVFFLKLLIFFKNLFSSLNSSSFANMFNKLDNKTASKNNIKKTKKKIFIPLVIFKHLEIRFIRAKLKSIIGNKLYTFIHDTKLETLWTILPIIIILWIAVPSFILLYALDATLDSSITLKAIGHQWYWSYECEFAPILYLQPETPTSLSFDSYMVYDSQLKKGQIRLLEVDIPVCLPYRLPIDIVVTSVDVIHSWAVPSLGIKVDGMPGRLNHSAIFIERTGVFFGQCSELCGVNHGFMPIKIIALNFSEFMDYCYNFVVLSKGKLSTWVSYVSEKNIIIESKAQLLSTFETKSTLGVKNKDFYNSEIF